MDTFLAIPTSTTYTPLVSPSAVVVENIVTPIIPAKPILRLYPKTYTTFGLTAIAGPNTA